VRTAADIPADPQPEWRFRRRFRLGALIRELWEARALVRTLAERELRIRYKQAVLGFAWAVVTPLVLMLAFTLFFRKAAKIDTGPVPYPLFAYVGLLPWTFFSTGVAQGGLSLVNNVPLLNKVYCPREVFPLANLVVAGIDSSIAASMLAVLFVVTGYTPKPTSLWVPVLLLVQVAFTLGLTLVTSAVLVFFRDLRHALPIVLQLGLFATPVAYGMDVVPSSLQVLYCAANPLAPVIDGYRRTILLGLPPNWELLLPGAITAIGTLVVGYAVFKRLEPGFADYA
jgi:ABC-type polysaccharide/polyol phosphate export permease